MGVAFLATPFRGSDAAKQAQWQVLVGGIMGELASRQLIDNLNSSDKELRKLTQQFAETAVRESVQLPIHCFYETRTTEMLRRFLQPGWAIRAYGILAAFNINTHKIVCLPFSLGQLWKLTLNSSSPRTRLVSIPFHGMHWTQPTRE